MGYTRSNVNYFKFKASKIKLTAVYFSRFIIVEHFIIILMFGYQNKNRKILFGFK